MQVSYQRDLYKVQLCCETKTAEKKLGYPLQMCLRNPIDGLLTCHVQTLDEKVSVCWDITSANSIKNLFEDAVIDEKILRMILKSLLRVMEGMERFLIPCEYLVLDPAYIFMDARQQCVNFICDFENMQSFHDSLIVCGEYVVEHMNHQDKETMRLGYGLYRLAMEDTFDKGGLIKLLEAESPRPSGAVPHEGRNGEKMVATDVNSFDDHPGKKVETPSQKLRREALKTFFEEEEQEVKKEKLPLPVLAAFGVIFMTIGLEAAVFVRNGKNISWQWLTAGGILIAMSVVVMVVLGILEKSRMKKKEAKEEEQEKRKKEQRTEKTAPEDVKNRKEKRKRSPAPEGREEKRKRSPAPEGREEKRKRSPEPEDREEKRKRSPEPEARKKKRKRSLVPEGRKEEKKMLQGMGCWKGKEKAYWGEEEWEDQKQASQEMEAWEGQKQAFQEMEAWEEKKRPSQGMKAMEVWEGQNRAFQGMEVWEEKNRASKGMESWAGQNRSSLGKEAMDTWESQNRASQGMESWAGQNRSSLGKETMDTWAGQNRVPQGKEAWEGQNRASQGMNSWEGQKKMPQGMNSINEKRRIHLAEEHNETYIRGQGPEFQEGATVALSALALEEKIGTAALIAEDGSRIPLKGKRIIIGKNKRNADILLTGSTISRLHACITKRDGAYFIEDLNSKNGTQVNGELIEPKMVYPLKSQDVICLADQIFRFELQG